MPHRPLVVACMRHSDLRHPPAVRYKEQIAITDPIAHFFRNRHVVVTGGLGFIGSNLAIRLARAGAQVTVIDSAVTGCGVNRHNLASFEIPVVETDIANAPTFADILRHSEVIFNIAGEISHIHSMQMPWRDAALNADAHLRFLDELSRVAPGIRVVYASTRQIFGIPQYLPVDEHHPIRPVDFNGIHKYAAAAYHLLYSTMGRIDAVILNLTNVYGPRMALNIPCQGFLSNFLRRALLGQTIEIFGDGRQLRDPVFVDDVTGAFLLAGATPAPEPRAFNVGGPAALPLAEIAQAISSAACAPLPRFIPFPPDRKRIDIGSYASDSSRITAALGWRPVVSFEHGLGATLEFYRSEMRHYLRPEDTTPVCPLEDVHAAVS
jgi:UDP-glucose 4-epimerase